MRAAGLLLAAGGSRRMGRPKQLLEWRGQSLARRATEALVASRCERVVVVLGAHAEAVKASLAGLPIEFVNHPGWRQGVGTSIRAGTTAIEVTDTADTNGANRFDAIVVALIDQPHVDAALHDALVAGIEAGHALAACNYAGILGAPAAFGREHFRSLRGLSGDRGAQAILRAHPETVWQVPFPAGAVDVDTQETYERLHS